MTTQEKQARIVQHIAKLSLQLPIIGFSKVWAIWHSQSKLVEACLSGKCRGANQGSAGPLRRCKGWSLIYFVHATESVLTLLVTFYLFQTPSFSPNPFPLHLPVGVSGVCARLGGNERNIFGLWGSRSSSCSLLSVSYFVFRRFKAGNAIEVVMCTMPIRAIRLQALATTFYLRSLCQSLFLYDKIMTFCGVENSSSKTTC